MLRAVTRIRLAMDAVGGVMNAVAGWSLNLCAVLICLEIAGRQVGFTLGATLEISCYILAFSISWGLAKALTERQHVRIDLILNRTPLRVRQLLHLVALLAMLTWALFLAYGAAALTMESYEFQATDRSTLGIPLLWPQGLWTAGIAFFAVIVSVTLIEVVIAILLGRPHDVERIMAPRTLEEEAREAAEAASMGPPRP
jgi:TRAP-type C4-dicarboxylate transport system permease small subunit